MTTEINVKASISDDFSTIIQGGKYEKLVLDLMNQSKRVFPSQYIHNESQSRGECDFVDIQSGERFDVKLAFNRTEGYLVASEKRNLREWFLYKLNEESEFGQCVRPGGIVGVETTSFYKTIETLLKKINADENAVFFVPYPIVPDGQEMHYVHFASDLLFETYKALRKNGTIGERRIYAIYPAMDHTVVLRCMNNGVREYIPSFAIDKFIRYDFSLQESS